MLKVYYSSFSAFCAKIWSSIKEIQKQTLALDDFFKGLKMKLKILQIDGADVFTYADFLKNEKAELSKSLLKDRS